MLNQYGWNLLQHPIVLQIQANTTSFSLVDLPPQARKAKLYICLQSGHCQGDSTVTWIFSTKVEMIKISGLPCAQNAWSVNSENIAIRLDEKKLLKQVDREIFHQAAFQSQLKLQDINELIQVYCIKQLIFINCESKVRYFKFWNQAHLVKLAYYLGQHQKQFYFIQFVSKLVKK
ncbi:unnamed protein product [Paramecium octaurelia]|uniref:Uncharacterized protein n=1 Tax=Paramecium octaurelia TaxID=43137 RepID=A0A8S1UW26_PAROT|nr:unnamed protein product [Paramecium octaurelia]